MLAVVALSTFSCQASVLPYQNKAGHIAEVRQAQWSKYELHAIAQTLAGECYVRNPLSEWLFFSKGRKRENIFRSDF